MYRKNTGGDYSSCGAKAAVDAPARQATRVVYFGNAAVATRMMMARTMTARAEVSGFRWRQGSGFPLGPVACGANGFGYAERFADVVGEKLPGV